MSTINRILTLALALVLSLVATTRAQASPPVPLVTGDWPPYTEQGTPGGGVATELIRAVFDEMGREARIDFYPWRRSEAVLRNGLVWAGFPYVITAKRRETFDFSEPFMEGQDVFFYFGDAMAGRDFDHLDELRPYRIGLASGYWYEEPFKEAGLTLDLTPTDLIGLRKLMAGRIDLYPLNEWVGLWLIDRHFPDQRHRFGRLKTPIRYNLSALMVSRDYPGSRELLQRFNEALARVKARGVDRRLMDDLRRRLGVEPLEETVGPLLIDPAGANPPP